MKVLPTLACAEHFRACGLAAHVAFLQACFDDPCSDTPRLVYADWLDENGYAERARLIRVQCQLARYDEEPRDWTNELPAERLRAEAEVLVQRQRIEWAKETETDWEVDMNPWSLSFDRGLPTLGGDFSACWQGWQRLPRELPLFQWHGVVDEALIDDLSTLIYCAQIRIVDWYVLRSDQAQILTHLVMRRELAYLAAVRLCCPNSHYETELVGLRFETTTPSLSIDATIPTTANLQKSLFNPLISVTKLALSYQRQTQSNPLWTTTNLTNVRQLRLLGEDVPGGAWRDFAKHSASLNHLKSVTFEEMHWHSELEGDIVRANGSPQLESFCLEVDGLDWSHVKAIVNSSLFSHLRTLRLFASSVNAYAADELLTHPRLRALQHLSFNSADYTSILRQIAQGPPWALVSLKLGCSENSSDLIKLNELAMTTNMPHLQSFACADISNTNFQLLADSPWACKLELLHLTYCYFSTEDLFGLARWLNKLTNVRQLSLSKSCVAENKDSLLTNDLDLPVLRYLDLSETALAGGLDMLGQARLPRLEWLNLAGNGLMHRLIPFFKSPLLRSVRYLDLSHNGIWTNEFRALVAALEQWQQLHVTLESVERMRGYVQRFGVQSRLTLR